jgi:restriction system protein
MSRYSTRWEVVVRHDGLNRIRKITGTDRRIVEEMAASQRAQWDAMWERRQDADARREDAARKRQSRADAAAYKAAQQAAATERTLEAQQALAAVRDILRQTLAVDDQVCWDDLKPRDPFSESLPRAAPPKIPPAEPQASAFAPELGFLDKLLRKRRETKEAAAKANYQAAYRAWMEGVKRVESENADDTVRWQKAVKGWEHRKARFEEEQRSACHAIDKRAERYLRGEVDTIEEYVDLVFSRSVYPDWYDRQWEIEFQEETRTLLIDYSLPNPEELPAVTEWRYVAARDDFASKNLTKAEKSNLYDDFIYQVCLRTLHEVIESDRAARHIGAVAFNGRVKGVDPSTGQDLIACICTVHTTVEEFGSINLNGIDPKACFKKLRGVSAARLDKIAPVAPLITFNRTDARFIDGQDVASRIDEGANLAAMDWQDFEHLIRQVFEWEFSTPGSEVKVTQGSRDGGVDAVAFDPDPIRGGKIVIQAKRYTNTVGVEAVRDLYGTVMNEGASKGILVTTSQFGPDARKFASGKPLTLIDGSNLLFLLQKQGIRGHIDVKAAKAQTVA